MPELPDVTVYVEHLERRVVGEPCPTCGAKVQRIAYAKNDANSELSSRETRGTKSNEITRGSASQNESRGWLSEFVNGFVVESSRATTARRARPTAASSPTGRCPGC